LNILDVLFLTHKLLCRLCKSWTCRWPHSGTPWSTWAGPGTGPSSGKRRHFFPPFSKTNQWHFKLYLTGNNYINWWVLSIRFWEESPWFSCRLQLCIVY
jgi:hypothetical protein